MPKKLILDGSLVYVFRKGEDGRPHQAFARVTGHDRREIQYRFADGTEDSLPHDDAVAGGIHCDWVAELALAYPDPGPHPLPTGARAAHDALHGGNQARFGAWQDKFDPNWRTDVTLAARAFRLLHCPDDELRALGLEPLAEARALRRPRRVAVVGYTKNDWGGYYSFADGWKPGVSQDQVVVVLPDEFPNGGTVESVAEAIFEADNDPLYAGEYQGDPDPALQAIHDQLRGHRSLSVGDTVSVFDNDTHIGSAACDKTGWSDVTEWFDDHPYAERSLPDAPMAGTRVELVEVRAHDSHTKNGRPTWVRQHLHKLSGRKR